MEFEWDDAGNTTCFARCGFTLPRRPAGSPPGGAPHAAGAIFDDSHPAPEAPEVPEMPAPEVMAVRVVRLRVVRLRAAP